MKRTFLAVALTIFACASIAVAQEDKTGTNMGVKPEGAKATGAAMATERLQLAYAAAKYGRETKSADGLILAAKIIKETPADKLAAAKKAEGGMADASKKTAMADMSADALLSEAKTYAMKDKSTMDRIKAVEKMNPGRGSLGGPKRTAEIVRAGATDAYNVAFRGGEQAIVIISGDGDTDLDLYIYDENGNLVSSDTDGLDDCIVRFYPKWTGNFTVRVKNLGRVYNRYVIATN
jgi:hypothetical protein